MKKVRRTGVHKLPRCRAVLMRAGVFPIRNHFYEPLFDTRQLSRPLSAVRPLPGIEFNVAGQLALLDDFRYGAELERLRLEPGYATEFADDAFGPGDADIWYSIIRSRKPRRIIEIGSGVSTRIARRAIAANRAESPDYDCRHLCIEPFKQPWLEQQGVEVLRSKVEDVARDTFDTLAANDILFIDSSHIIRPQGDVLCEYLELLPRLAHGVIVHVHDIFTPRDYPEHWITERVRFWNEQYLLEAFLTCNRDWKIIAALNLLHHDYPERLLACCPSLGRAAEPGSIYLQRVA